MRRSLIAPLLLMILGSTAFSQVTITIDTTSRFQTIEGWGHGGDLFSNLYYMGGLYQVSQADVDSINYQQLRFIAHELGLTGSRMWEVGPRVDGTGMDNGDCDSIDWTKFQARPIDTLNAHYAEYFKTLVNQEGYQTSFYSSPTYPTFATAFKPWVLNHPGERAQQVWANAIWWKQLYGIDINYAVLYNEPSGSVTPQILADDIHALAPRLKQLGLPTTPQYAEGVGPHTTWNFITAVQSDSLLFSQIGRFSYHNYGGADPYRSQIRDLARSLGITTAQTEMGNPTIDDLYQDLTLGGVSYWEVGFAGQTILVPSTGNTSWTPSNTYYRLRQVLHYVRPGAVRIGATSNDSTIMPLAFERDGEITLVIINAGSTQTVNVSGLPARWYGQSQSAAGATSFREFGTISPTAGQSVAIGTGSAGSVTTVYPVKKENHPPTVMAYGANPGYVVAPNGSTQLSVQANDIELDILSYHWSVVSQPSGANAVLVTPNAAKTSANGLSKAGLTVFNVDVTDGIFTESRKVYVLAVDSNPPPIVGQAGFRFAAPYGLVFTNPGDTTHANVELPTSSATLQVGIGDIANSSFNGRGTWTIVSQPPGGVAKLDTTIYIYVSIRSNVSNMTVPGDYVFQCNITNPGHPDLIARTICTVHAASSGPVMQSISALPATVSLPSDSSALSAITTDPQNQLLRHWWVVKTAPPGAKPVFDHQGLPKTTVRGLSVTGTYTFTLRCFDDVHVATKDVSLKVVLDSVKGILALAPHELDFPSIDTGKTEAMYASMRDTGNGALTVRSIGITPPFSLDSALLLPILIQPGELVKMKIAFSPTTVGPVTGWCFVTTADGRSDSIALRGVGLAVSVGGVVPMKPSTTDDILVFPNPITNEVTIQTSLDSYSSARIELIDVLGRVVLRKPVNFDTEGKATIPIHSVPNGTYRLILSTGTSVRTTTVVKR